MFRYIAGFVLGVVVVCLFFVFPDKMRNSVLLTISGFALGVLVLCLSFAFSDKVRNAMWSIVDQDKK